MTPEQYLEAERAAEFKSEYYNGHMYAMAGGTQVHNFILGNTAAALLPISRRRGCVVNTSDLRLRVSHGGLYTYPDIMVICGPTRFADDQKDTVLNPILIIEVLSPSTEAHDRGFKFAQYRELESLQEYVLIAQKEPRIERFQRQPSGQWLLTEYKGLEAEAHFESIDSRIRLADIYTDVSFPSSQDENRVV
jgi:Uma2 family endonuclease